MTTLDNTVDDVDKGKKKKTHCLGNRNALFCKIKSENKIIGKPPNCEIRSS